MAASGLGSSPSPWLALSGPFHSCIARVGFEESFCCHVGLPLLVVKNFPWSVWVDIGSQTIECP